jgi:chemotaxis protein MotB
MLKHMLLVALAVSLFGITGCPELKNLRQQNANLKLQLTQSQQALNDANSSIATLTTMRDKYRDQLTTSQQDNARMSAVVQQLKDQQALLQKQRADLAALVKNYAGINVEARGEGNFIVMENEILFDSGKADLKEPVKAALDKVAAYLVDNPGVPIRIDGHTDGVPIRVSQWQDNYELSAMRAHAVMKYLVSKGVDPSRMYIAGFGPNRPLVQPPQPEAPLAANRRVEILLVPKGTRSVSDILNEFSK